MLHYINLCYIIINLKNIKIIIIIWDTALRFISGIVYRYL